MRLIAATVVVVVGLGSRVQAAQPSFDCQRAAAPIEHLICGSDRLAQLDGDLSAAFRVRREGLSDEARAPLLADQRRWLTGRLSACGVPGKGDMAAEAAAKAETCLTELYRTRIAEIGKPPAAVAAAAPVAPSPAPAPVMPPKSELPDTRPPAATAPAGPQPKLAASLFPAQGQHETTVTIPSFGRYSFSVHSDQGTALQLVDRMAGPGPLDGAAGSVDGRVDGFLDHGIYKLRLISDPRGSGDAELSVRTSTELEPEPVRLVELKPVQADLADHEQRSYWLEITERKVVAIEAAGRYLADLRLWKDGVWLVAATPETSVRDPGTGQPLAVRQLTARLEPGLYKLTAYGGAGEKWAQSSGAKPFTLRWGIPQLPTVGRAVHEASASGVDEWLVPRAASYFRIDTDKPEHTALTVSPYDPARPFFSNGDHASIEKNSRNPLAELEETAGDKGFWLVTVERTPGARYRLTTLDAEAADSVALATAAGSYFVAYHRGFIGDDAPDPTSIVVKDNKEAVADSAIHLDPAKPWQRRFNLLNKVTLYLAAPQAMALKVTGSGAEADFRVEPFLTTKPTGGRTPPLKASGSVWPIDAGYSILTITPRENGKGVLTLTLGAEGITAPAQPATRLAAFSAASLTFEPKAHYELVTSLAGDDHAGVIVRRLPLDLADALSVELAPGRALSLPVKAPGAGHLQAMREDGQPLPIALDGQPATVGPAVTGGPHTVVLTLVGDHPSYVSLAFQADDMRPEAPLPALAAGRTTPPALPQLVAGKPAFLDLARNQTVTYAIPVEGPALYRLESQGLIETEGALRTRTLPALAEDHANGVGRNFLLQQYLGDGDYQVAVHAAGKSHGRIGLSLAKTPVTDRGPLDLGRISRLTLPPGEAAAYQFHIDEAGDYSLKTVGLNRTFAMRLDDADGWPVLAPGSDADVSLALRPGDYRLILLPQSVESRAVTLLERKPAATERSGHGPFPAAFDTDLANRWMEPESGQPRSPDLWKFTLPAPTVVTLQIDRGMRAVLKAADGDHVATEAAAWSGPLPQGDYAVEVTSEAPNSRVDYTLNLATRDLMAGESRALTAPGRLPVAIGALRQIELSSLGSAPVRASLLDADGRLVAVNDGRDNDWNFAIAGSFAPGRYTLQVDPVGAASAQTTVSLTQYDELFDKPVAAGQSVTLADGAIHVVPLDGGKPGGLLVASAQSAVPTGLTLEAKAGDGWRHLASTSGVHPFLAVPWGDGPDTAYRVRVWTVDHGKQPVILAADAVTPAESSEAAFSGKDGIALAPLKLGDETLGVGRVKLDRPGILALRAGGETLRWSSAAGVALDRDESGSLVAVGSSIWLIDRAPNKLGAGRVDPAVEAAHLTLKPGPAVTLPIAAADGPTLWRIEGLGGQPGLSIAGGDAAAPALPMAVGPDSPTRAFAFGFAPGGLTHPILKLWRADRGDGDLPITIDRLSFTKPRDLALGFGLADGALAGMEAVAVALPAGDKRLALTLPLGTAALFQKAGSPRRLLWSADARAQIVESDDDQILLLHTVKEAAPFALSIEPRGDGKPLSIGAGAILTRASPTPGVLHLTVDPAAGATTVRATGSAEAMTVVDASGHVSRGLSAPAGAGAVIDVAFKPGQLAIGLDAPPLATEPDSTLTLPASVALHGVQMVLRVPAGPARLLHVETDTPVLLRSHGAGQPTLFEAGASLNLVLGQDQSADLQILAVGSAPLSGTARFEAVLPVPIADGLGPKRRVSPGQSRLFSFSLKAERSIGVGARASADIVTTRLLTAAGEELSRGLVAMQTLKPGNYLLAIDVPSDGVAVDVEPALVGATLPGNGPPDDVKASYAALVGAKP
ncbi:MAG TPA: lysozyme inhibitor LprI family protein [Aliidongia sp.]|nr:lysozyme inhibitor LprI family protein [Aliidongia sp.]